MPRFHRPARARAAVTVAIVETLEQRQLLTTWYVDNGTGGTGIVGTDTTLDATGTSLAKPFRSIDYASQRAVAGDTILVRKGTYREEVRPLNNGTAAAPIVYMPYKGEPVSIRGTDLFGSGGWTQVSGTSTYWTPWNWRYTSTINNADQVFANDQMLNLARWPDQGNSNLSVPNQATVDEVVSSTLTGARAWGGGYEVRRIVFKDAAFTDATQNWTGAKIWMNNGGSVNGQDETQDGNGITGTVVSASPATGTVTVDIASAAATGTNQPNNYEIGRGSRYYLFDPVTLSASGLPHPGQWWRDARGTADAADDRLYLRTFDNANPATKTIEAKRRDYAFNFDAGTGTTDLGRSHITVKNFNVFGASIITDRQLGTGSQSGDGGTIRTNTVAGAHHIVLDGLRMKYVSHFVNQAGDLQAQWSQSSGVILSGSDNVFQNGEIAWSAGNGILVTGLRNKVLNNKIHDTGYTAAETAAIQTGNNRKAAGRSIDTEIAYNEVYNTGIDGIVFDALWNSTGNRNDVRARVHHNVVYNTVLQSADSGAIKMYGSDGNWARIDHNVIYNTGGAARATQYLFWGIYLDFPNAFGGYVIDHNLIYATANGMNVNGAANTEIYNNTILAGSAGRTVGRHAIGNDGRNQRNAQQPGVAVRNNLSNLQPRGITGDVNGVANAAVVSHNVWTATETTTWFVDPANATLAARDYAPANNATTQGSVIDKGIATAPFQDTAAAPDVGAIELGQTRWTAGVGRLNNQLSTAVDIGAVGHTGQATYANGAFALRAAGADIWGAADAFQYAYRAAVGDGSIVARVSSLDNTDPWAKAGLAYRDDTTPGGRYVGLFVTPANGVVLQWRDAAGGASSDGGNAASAFVPRWLKLTRIGNTFRGFYATTATAPTSADWIPVLGASRDVALSRTGYVGLALASHNDAAIANATFTNLSVTDATTPHLAPPPNTAPLVTTPTATPNPVTGKTTALSVTATDDGGEAKLTYTWSATAKPTGSNPTLSANGTNAAKKTTVTFDRAGTYTFTVTVSDGSLSSKKSVNVTVRQTFTRVSVSPSSTTVVTGGAKRFTASARDQFNVPMSTQPTFAWSTTAGTITQSGSFVAPSTAGTVKVSAAAGGLAGSATVTVSVPTAAPTAPTTLIGSVQTSQRVRLTWQDRATTESGFRVRYSTDKGATWRTLATIAPFAGTGTVTYTSATLATGSYQFRVTAFNAAGESAATNIVTLSI